jgi:hypothetical protein
MAGYSGTPLAQKLGIGAGARVLVIGEPAGFQAALGELPEGVERTSSLAGKRPFGVAVIFVEQRAKLSPAFARITPRMTSAGGVWIAWPKRTSKIATDVTEQVLRDVLLPTGWVDNKVCAIDERWSGLRFVLRKELRAGKAATARPSAASLGTRPSRRADRPSSSP